MMTRISMKRPVLFCAIWERIQPDLLGLGMQAQWRGWEERPRGERT